MDAPFSPFGYDFLIPLAIVSHPFGYTTLILLVSLI
jgi:hypothetical protein